MIINTLQELESIIPALLAESTPALDTETTGLKESDRLFSLIISTAAEDYYLNFNGAGKNPTELKDEVFQKSFGPPMSKVDAGKLLEPVFADPSKTWFLQNAKFDMHMIAKEGWFLAGGIFCTAAQERILKNNHMSYRLQDIAPRYGVQKDDTAEKVIRKQKLYTKVPVPGKKKVVEIPHYDQLPYEVVTKYGGHDGKITRHCGLQIKAKQIEEQISQNLIANEMKLTKTCFKIEREGIRIDPLYTKAAWDYEESLIREAKTRFLADFAIPYPETITEVRAFFKALGVALPKTEKGNESANADALDGIDHPSARVIEQVRGLEKRISTYYSSFLWDRDSSNLIRPDMCQYGTETGRFSYRNPNLQNLPKEDEAEDLRKDYLVRGCFIPRDGNLFVSIDYAQQEYRMMLDYAGELKLIEQVMAGADLHQATADMVGITRKQAKTLNFAILYGAGPAKLAGMLGITIAEAKYLMDKYFSRLPKVLAFKEQVVAKGAARGFVTNWFGRRCRIANREWAYVLPNHLIQGGCGDVIKIAMNRVDDLIEAKKCQMRMRLTVHDELLLELPPGEVSLIHDVVEIMESIYPAYNGMKLTTDVGHSFKSFSAKDKVKGFPA